MGLAAPGSLPLQLSALEAPWSQQAELQPGFAAGAAATTPASKMGLAAQLFSGATETQYLTAKKSCLRLLKISSPSWCSAGSSRPQRAFYAQRSLQHGKLKCLPDSWLQKLCFSLHLSSNSDTVRQANIEGHAAVPNTLQKMTVVSN